MKIETKDDLTQLIDNPICLDKNKNNNIYLIYFFHIVQSSGIIITSVAVSYDKLYLIWLGLGLNVIASLINIYENVNNCNILKKKIKCVLVNEQGDHSEIQDIYSNAINNNNDEENVNPLLRYLLSQKEEIKIMKANNEIKL